jgi:hypothetical protein
MGAAQVQADLYQMRQSGNAAILNPGASGTFDLRGRDLATVTVTATGTYTLPSSPVGTQLLVCCDDTSTVTLADASGTFHIFTGTSGSTAVLCEATDSNSWGATRLTRNTVNSAHDSSEISYADSSGVTAETTVDGAITEIYDHILHEDAGHIDIPLSCFREVDADGDVGNLAAVGGVLASDSTPIYEGAGTTNAQRINWATGNVDRIGASVTLPADFNDAADCTIDFIVASGTTNDFDATVVTNWNGGADVTDTVVDTGSATVHASSATVAAADIPASPLCVSVSVTPPAHATDAYHLYGVRIRYTKKLLSA